MPLEEPKSLTLCFIAFLYYFPMFIAIITTWVETQTTNQQPYDQGRWPEANTGEQYT